MNDNFLSGLGHLVTAPRRLMDAVAENPRWWPPGLLVFLLVGAGAWITMPVTAPEQMEIMRDSRLMQLVPEEQWQAQYEDALNISPDKRAIQAVSGGFTWWLAVLAFGLIMGFFARMSGGQGTVKQSLAVTSWAALIPYGLGTIVSTVLIMVTESAFRVTLGLAALFPDPDPGSVIYKILTTYGEFFVWWGLVVMVIGFQRVHGLTRGAAIVSIVLPWVLLNLIPLGFRMILM